jgi:hypothetical protein
MPRPASSPAAICPLRPAVIAIEGCCFVGKTSLVLALSQHLGVAAIAEYADLARLPPFPARDPGDIRVARGLPARRGAPPLRRHAPRPWRAGCRGL